MSNKTGWKGDFFKTDHSDTVISNENDSSSEHQSLLTMSSLCICHEQKKEVSERPDQDISNNEKDDGVITLDRALRVLSKLENKKHKKRPHSSQTSTTQGLGSLLKLQDSITSHQMHKLSKLLASENATLKEECLKIINQLLSHPKLAEILVKDLGIQDPIMVLARDEDMCERLNLPADESICRIQTLVLHVLDKILRTPSLDFMAIHRRLHSQVYPKLISCLHTNTPWEVKYAACRVLQRLAQQKDFALKIRSESNFLLQQLKFGTSQLKGAYADVLKVLFLHPGLIEVEHFGTEVLLPIKGLLKDSICDSQKEALSLVACAMSDCQGIEVVAKDTHLVACIFACLLMSRCKKVRAIACQAASIMTSLHQSSVVYNMMEGIRFCVDPDRNMEESCRRVTYPGVAKLRAHLHLWKCFDVVLDFLLNVICREGELDVFNGQMFCSLPLNGAIDDSKLLCLAYGIQLVVNICVWPVQRRGRSSNSIKTTRPDILHLCHDRNIRKKYSMLNHQLSLEQWDRFGSTITTLLRFLCKRDLSRLCTISDAPFHQHDIPGNRPASKRACASELPCRHDSSMSIYCDPDIPVMSDSNVFNTADSSVRSSLKTPCSSSVTTEDSCFFTFNPSNLMTITPCITPEESAMDCKESSGRCHIISDSLASNAVAAREGTILKSSVPISSGKLLTLPELELLKSILHFIFCISLTSCKEIVSPLAKEITQFPLAHTKPQEQKLGQSKRWVPGKQHLVRIRQHIATHNGSADAVQMLPDETESKESVSERWRIRKVLFNKELFANLGKLMQLADLQIKILCSLVLRAAVQPLIKYPVTDSEDVACALLPVIPKQANVTRTTTYRHSSKPRKTAKARCNRLSSVYKHASQTLLHASSREAATVFQESPIIPYQLRNTECLKLTVKCCGVHILDQLFSPSSNVRFCSLALLHDIVKFSAIAMHMELSRLGCVSKLLDVIRINDNNSELQVIALTVVQLLLKNNEQLRQLFSFLGGRTLMAILSRKSCSSVRAQARDVQAIFTKVKDIGCTEQRTGSRPLFTPRLKAKTKPHDVWEHITERWNQEDKVVKVLQKFH